MSRLSALWDYRNEPLVAFGGILALIVIVGASVMLVAQVLVRDLPVSCEGVWFPSSGIYCQVYGADERSGESQDNTAVSRLKGGVPIGTVVPFFGLDENVPEGWAVCDGGDVPAGSPIKMDANEDRGGRQLPDLRNRFIRGSAMALNVSSLSVGGQDEVNSQHSHQWAEKRGLYWYAYDKSGAQYRIDDWDNGIGDKGKGNRPLSNDASLDLYTNNHMGTQDNRPAYVELRYIIKVFDTVRRSSAQEKPN